MNARILMSAVALMMLPIAATADEAVHDAFAGIGEMQEVELGQSRGADSNTVIVSTRQDFDAVVHGNEFHVGTLNNGPINLGEGAFDNFSGIGVNVLNTGNANGFSVGVGVSVYLQ